MKQRYVLVLLTGVLIFCTGATVWEGSAGVSSQGELPEQGLYIATNALPRNTVVDITNLVTGNSVRVTVAEDLEFPGLLALLSQEAAASIGVGVQSISRIRMTLPAHTGAPSHDAESTGEEEALFQPDPSRPASQEPFAGADYESGGYDAISYDDDTDTNNDDGGNSIPVIIDEEKKALAAAQRKKSLEEWPYRDGSYEFSMVPSEERPPRAAPNENTAPPRTGTAPSVQTEDSRSGREDFSIPQIGSLEKGKYYLQLGTFNSVEPVEAEAARIRLYPLAVQKEGGPERPVYRLLIGPLTRGESGALLRRFRTNYPDAFIRYETR